MAPQALPKTNRRLPTVEPVPIPARREEPERPAWSAGEGHSDCNAANAVARFLRSLHVLLRSARLYQKNHPRLLESLESAERNLRTALELISEIAVGVERDRLVVPMLQGQALPDHRGELKTLAEELSRCGVTSLVILAETNLGELDKLAHVLNERLHGAGGAGRHAEGAAARAHGPSLSARLAEHHISGIRLNVPIERKGDPALASLVTALLAYGGTPERAVEEPAAEAPQVKSRQDLTAALNLLAKMGSPMEIAETEAPQEAARALHDSLAQADRGTVKLLVGAMSQKAPREGEKPKPYVTRLADTLVLNFVAKEFAAGRVKPSELKGLFGQLGRELARGAGGGAEDPALLAQWSDEAHAERLYERFWAELAAREKAAVLLSHDAWCVPVAALRRYLEQLSDAGREPGARAAPREARQVLLNYARCLESEREEARRSVASGLADLQPLVERLWPHQVPEELGRGVVQALAGEKSPGVAALLSVVTENLARLAVAKGDFAEFERILEALERAPRDAEHAHLASLASRLVADECWLLLVDATLANRPLDPVLPRLLRRSPERLLDRLALLLTGPSGADSLQAMARLLRAIGEPVVGILERRLYDRRRQRTATAAKLLAATQPERLAAALPRALPNWDWHLQDLAVSELSQLGTPGAAEAFLACVTQAHHMVAPMMIDQIGLAEETSAVPLLLEIAAGENEHLRDVFIRIKAMEALGRMRVAEAAELMRTILHERSGLTHVEPAGLRAAAEEALALIENLPSSARAAYEAAARASVSFARPRRYLRVPLEAPYAAQIEGSHSGPARVRTISLGGAFLESNRQLSVGDAVRVEIRAGLRKIHSTAVVRNVTPHGGGVEFVHMKDEDREKLRRLVRRLLRD